MSRFLTFICGVTLVLGFAGVALATTFTDIVFEPSYLDTGQSVDWRHDISDNGFDPSQHTLDSATLQLFLSDDWQGGDFNDTNDALVEIATIYTGDQFYDLGEIDFGFYTVSLTAWVSLQNTGLLDVTLTSTQGDFWFVASRLEVTNTNLSIPDATTLVLLGSACLIGFAGFRRKFKK